MKIKFLVLFAAVISSLVIVGNHESRQVRAGLTDYDTLWNAMNIYDSYDLTLGFANLDSSSSYRWTVQLVDITSGEPFVDIGHHTHIPGTTTDSFSIGPGVVALQNHLGDWPFLYSGPYQVKDNWGQVVLRGFVTPDPDLYTINGWKLATGNNAYADKVVIGSPHHVIPDQNPVYNETSIDGWQYDPLSMSQAAIDTSEIAIMHFNLDCASYLIGYGPNDGYYIYDFGGTEQGRIPFTEIVDFQERELIWPPGGCGAANQMIFESFIPLNVNGLDISNWADTTRADAKFTTYQNPYDFPLSVGAYYVQKVVGGVPVADGEAPFFISNADKGNEYKIEIGLDTVSIGGTQQMIFRAATEEIWDDYHAFPICNDVAASWVDTTVYSYSPNRSYSDSVASFATTDRIRCEVWPLSIGTVTMTPAHAAIITYSPFYEVVPGAATFEESINDLIAGAKLNTDTGLNIVFAGLLAAAMLLVTLIPVARKNTMSYLAVWTLVGGAWAVGGPATSLGILMFALITVVLWILVLSGNQGGSELSDA